MPIHPPAAISGGRTLFWGLADVPCKWYNTDRGSLILILF